MIRPLFLAAALATLPALAAADTPEAIRACEADRTGPGCATLRSRLFVCERAAAMTGCAELIALRDAALAEPEPEPEAPAEPEAAAAEPADCPVIDSADWAAVVGPVAGAEGAQLIVTGQVTLPTPGWTVAVEAGMADRSATPVQRVILSATPPEAMVAQVLTDYEVRLETPSIGTAPAGQAPYRGVIVTCGALVLVELTEVGLAE